MTIMHCANNLYDELKCLKEDGYRYMIIPEGARSKIWLTKSRRSNTSEYEFKEDALFEEFRLDTFEKALLKILPRNTIIKI